MIEYIFLLLMNILFEQVKTFFLFNFYMFYNQQTRFSMFLYLFSLYAIVENMFIFIFSLPLFFLGHRQKLRTKSPLVKILPALIGSLQIVPANLNCHRSAGSDLTSAIGGDDLVRANENRRDFDQRGFCHS